MHDDVGDLKDLFYFIQYRWYPVMSRSVQPVIFADLHVVLKFEPVDGRSLDKNCILPTYT